MKNYNLGQIIINSYYFILEVIRLDINFNIKLEIYI